MEKINLFCLPFAGGNKYSYKGYMKLAPKNIELIPLEIPGRGARYKEPLLTNLQDIVADIYDQISDNFGPPYAIYGHSMGTLVGYLLTKEIIRKNMPQPLHLFFTGRGGPSVIDHEEPGYLLPKEKFIQKLRELGGSPDEILADDALMDFFEPIIRADFQATETYEYITSSLFNIPITIMIGLQEKVTYQEAMAWQKETTATVEVRQFPGKHFFIYDFEPEIMKLITTKVTA